MEESLPAIWASMAGWCTPTVLFIVINIVIGTIFFSSSLARSSGEPNGGHNLARTASVLPRLKSLNSLFRQRTEETTAIAALLSPEPEVDVAEKPQGKEAERHLGKSVSEGPKKVIKEVKMKKSASSKAVASSKKVVEEEEVVVRRPATTRATPAKVDDGVDAKADDFINRFKQQLKLQRLDSISRYKEMINRGK